MATLALTASAPRSEHGAMPLAPIDRPKGLFARFLYFATRRRYGKTPTAFRVVYPRSAWIGLVSAVIAVVLELALSIDSDLRFLLSLVVAMRNGCTFCEDLTRAEAVRARIGRAKLEGLLDFESSEAFTPREKAALAYAAAVGRSLRVEDGVFERLKEHLSEREVVEVVWVCAVESYFNAMALPLRIGSDGLAGGAGPSV